MQYGPLWRVFRKLVHQNFMEAVVEKNYVPVQNAEAVQMLYDLCQRPDQHMLHPKKFSNSVAMSIIFGMRTPTLDTPNMTRLYHIMTAKRLGSNMNSLYSSLLNEVRTRRENPKYPRNTVMDSVLDQNEKLGLTGHQIYFFCGVLNEGASDTTATAIQSFIHAMSKLPVILRKAQMEVDGVVGEDRLGRRFGRIMCVCHDWVDGYFIPKGSTVIINVWGLHRDHYGYGSGRRICPGMHLAERNMFLAIVKLIWAFDFGPDIDEKTGLPVDVDVDPQTGYKEGLVLGARSFACRISMRSDARRDTIVRKFEKVSADVFSKYDFKWIWVFGIVFDF
ncbi:hypothetical protein N7481_012805 [Penicillium waksmanii]|uniref:uncharacterized protein n=1 Tax=Penicillium waksmanii TaxID=69791 RepID=UPI002549226D|nr:uncharacterized protein N7481_012805 [Penicillium waksmanii]KAJ5966091.1 hypothetical protein N7481_012805 [Penicillium waksmanii]